MGFYPHYICDFYFLKYLLHSLPTKTYTCSVTVQIELNRSLIIAVGNQKMKSYPILKPVMTVCLGLGMCSQVFADNLVETYADIAEATYEDSLITAKVLDAAIQNLIDKPTAESLASARSAWIESRVPYQQSEAYRFGNPIVDEWEGKVNAWPLDEGLIDYVDSSYGTDSENNDYYVVNVIANSTIAIGGQEIDAASITPDLLENSLQEVGGNEANVATGYHAIEFLLWGQDLNGNGAGAGNRPHTDFDTENCTNGHCARRAEYLAAASALLITDLEAMVAAWGEEGAARSDLTSIDQEVAVARMLTGLGSLSYGELAGERMRLGLMLHDPEEEHDCFSDNTHNSHFYDALGIRNVYLGEYERIDGSKIAGPSLSGLVAGISAELDQEMQRDLGDTMARMGTMKSRAEGTEAYDQMIAEGNEEGNAIVQSAVDGLVKQTQTIERIVAALDVSDVTIEGSDSLDDPNAVFK